MSSYADHRTVLVPEGLAGERVEGDDAVVVRQRGAAPLEEAFAMGGEFVEAVDEPLSGNDAIVQKAVTRLGPP